MRLLAGPFDQGFSLGGNGRKSPSNRPPWDEGAIMAELDEPGDEPNFDLFGSFGLDFFSDNELLLTETDLTEQTEQTESEQLNAFMLLKAFVLLRHSHRQNQDVLDTLTKK